MPHGIHVGGRVLQDSAAPGNAYAIDAPYAEPPGGDVELQREECGGTASRQPVAHGPGERRAGPDRRAGRRRRRGRY